MFTGRFLQISIRASKPVILVNVLIDSKDEKFALVFSKFAKIAIDSWTRKESP